MLKLSHCYVDSKQPQNRFQGLAEQTVEEDSSDGDVETFIISKPGNSASQQDSRQPPKRDGPSGQAVARGGNGRNRSARNNMVSNRASQSHRGVHRGRENKLRPSSERGSRPTRLMQRSAAKKSHDIFPRVRPMNHPGALDKVEQIFNESGNRKTLEVLREVPLEQPISCSTVSLELASLQNANIAREHLFGL
jgi:hypothetical protein